jgi:hypothetical protein
MHERPLLRIAPLVPVRTEVQTLALWETNTALREGRLRRAAVLTPGI